MTRRPSEVLRDLAAKYEPINTVICTDHDRNQDVRVSTLLLDEAERLERAGE